LVNRSTQFYSVISCLAAHAVSHPGAGSQPKDLSTSIGHGMVPKIFWAAEGGRGIQLQKHQLIEP
jgi:hypothetical protein